VQRLDTKQLPEINRGRLQKTLASANKLVLSLDTGYGDNTKFNPRPRSADGAGQ